MSKFQDWLEKLLLKPLPAEVLQEPTAVHAYSADEPIASKDEDRLNRWVFAKRIADTLTNLSDPSGMVIGIYGPWGDGKTSVLRMMESSLAENDSVILVRFNPWYFKSEEQMLRGFFATLAEAAGKSLRSRKETIGETLTKYGSLLSPISGGDAATGLGAALSTVEIEDLKKRLDEILKASNKRIVVMVDDIDRLDHDEIHAVFKLVKLSAGFSRTSYVLAFDDGMVSEALGRRYGSGDARAGRNFLEKIVQVPLRVPDAATIELRRLAFEGVERALNTTGIELKQQEIDAFGRHYIDGLEERVKTPRQAKLYGNALAFALPVLKGEVDPVDHLLIEGIRVFYPNLYATIRDNPKLFLEDTRSDQEKTRRKNEVIDGALKHDGVDDAEAVKDGLIQPLFPRAIGNMGYGDDWDNIWAEEKRIRSADYFDRYFQYAVPPGDVADSAISELLAMAQAGSGSDVDRRVAEIGTSSMPALVKKLRRQVGRIPQEAVARLALGIARNGALIPKERSLFSDWGATQGAILVMKLTKRLPDIDARTQVARSVIQEAEPLVFAWECLRWFRKDEPDEEELLPAAAVEELGSLIAVRIKDKAAEGALYKVFGNDARRLMWAWNKHGPTGEAAAQLRAWLDSNPDEVFTFLESHVGTAWEMESGLPTRSRFERESYDEIAKLILPEVIVEKLRARYGEELDNPNFYLSEREGTDRQLAHQFMVCHQRALQERVEASDSPAANDEDETALDEEE
jgi:hypothetical protein